VRGFAGELVNSNASARSWREKLAVVQDLLVDDARVIGHSELADIAVYLRFLSTGEISCGEDGRHFRPSHHARIATQIHERLCRLATPASMFLLRKIVACLPSTAAPFQRSEPLTRIRDIAHRNDIPHDLKREIKTTLQNKLHRCAGPEDLVTSQRLLERITAPGVDYSRDFVEEFKVFHGELTEFFNARSLEERLNAITQIADDGIRKLIGEFLAAKHQRGAEPTALLKLTQLRQRLLEMAKSKIGAEHQELWLADIALEEFAFALLSEILNCIPVGTTYSNYIGLLAQILANLQLSQIAPDEVLAIQGELEAASAQCSDGDRDSLLRLKAAVERARRLAGAFSDALIAQLAERAATLGRELGVAPHAIRVFAEGEVRAHLVFQLDKLASELLRHLREALGQPPWAVIVPGQAIGRVVLAESLADLASVDESMIVLLAHAEGDEEIPSGVKGILLAHELPHLSHLGVRARQAAVVVACCEEVSLFASLREHEGQSALVVANSDGIECAPAPKEAGPNRGDRIAVSVIPKVKMQSIAVVLPLEKIHANTGGNKSAGARRLLELAKQKGAGFSAPDGLVIPFGVMEACLRVNTRLDAEYRALVERINQTRARELATATAHLRKLILSVIVPEGILAASARVFTPEQRLAVRSSANSEDLPHMAGAGLHESVAGVTIESFADAVKTVWASLWTERAAASRRQAGVPQEAAHMAVLIQPLIEPELSFILHTVNPLNHNARECYVELAVGLGETLASATTRGTPYRMVCDRDSGQVTMLAFANFSYALEVASDGHLVERRLDHSSIPFTTDVAMRAELAARIATVAGTVEEAFGAPQDVEGVIRGDEIILVQSRTQQGIPLQS